MATKKTLKSWRAKNPILLAREKLNMSRQALAIKCGVQTPTVTLWEDGKLRPDIDSMRVMGFEVFDVKIYTKLEDWFERLGRYL